MGLRNIECPGCGEPMWIEQASELVWDYYPGSWEIKALFAAIGRGVVHVWACLGCGYFELIDGGRVLKAA